VFGAQAPDTGNAEDFDAIQHSGIEDYYLVPLLAGE
jgi:hypothetical protein